MKLLLLVILFLVASCSKKPESSAKDEGTLDEISTLGYACLSIYYKSDAARGKETFLKFIKYLDGINVNANNSDEVFSHKALALARLAYIGRYLSGIEINWSEPITILKKTSYGKNWPDEQAQFYMMSIIINDAKYVAWINEKEIRESIPENWLTGSQNNTNYHKQILIDHFLSEEAGKRE